MRRPLIRRSPKWRVAPAGEEATRFAAYIAALDQEETAYADSISKLERWMLASVSDLASEPRSASG